MPESIADLEIDSGLVIGQPPQALQICVAVCVNVCCPQLVLVMHDLFQFVLEFWKDPKFCVGASF
eukprot:415671-Pelagomonas_calceolata.AAC.1